MKQSFKSKVISCAVTALSLIGGLMVPVHAANYTPVAGTSTTFNKYFVMDANANVPNETFSYTVTPGTAQAATTSTMAVYAGVGTPTIADVVFSPSDTSSLATTAATGDSVELDAGEAYVKKVATVSFAGINFDEPGIYRYLINEDVTAKQGVTFDTQRSNGQTEGLRILDVYVIDNNGSLAVDTYVIHEGKDNDTIARNATSGSSDVTSSHAELTTKSDGYVNEYTTYDINFEKVVSGNQASQDKYFKFDLTIENAGHGDKYRVDVVTDAEAAPLANSATKYAAADMSAANTIADTNNSQTVLIADATGKITHTFYLKHNQSVTVYGLPKDATYALTEDAEDYTKTEKTTANTDNVSGTFTKDIKTGYTNTRSGFTPTGIFENMNKVMPLVLLAGLGIAYAVADKKRKKNLIDSIH